MPTTTKLLGRSLFTGTDGNPTSTEADLAYVAGTPAAGQPLIQDSSGTLFGYARAVSVAFIEDGSGTSYTGTVAIPPASLVWDIQFRNTALWNGTSAAMDLGDDDDPNGYFAAINLKATDLLVGQVLSINNSEYWGGKQGVYLVAATGLRSANYYAAANNIIAVVTPGAADGSAGRSFMHVLYSTTVDALSVNV